MSWNDTKLPGEPDMLPCPLCGSAKTACVGGVDFVVKCEGCWDIRTTGKKSKIEAIEAWNKRVPQPPSEPSQAGEGL